MLKVSTLSDDKPDINQIRNELKSSTQEISKSDSKLIKSLNKVIPK